MASPAARKAFDFTLKDGRVVTIRPLSPRENPKKIQAFGNALVRSRAIILQDTLWTLKEERAFVKSAAKEMRANTACYWVAVSAKGDVASLFSATRGRGQGRDIIHFAAGVTPSYQGHGLGEMMMRTTMHDAIRSFKPRLLALDVLDVNKKAIHMYRKLGFRIVARKHKWGTHYGREHDSLTMAVRVKKKRVT